MDKELDATPPKTAAIADAPIALRPVRVQRRRVKGWRMPENTVYVGRGSIFGNISVCTRPHNCALRPCACCDSATDGRNWCCVLAFREYAESGIERRACRSGLFRYALDAFGGYEARDEMVRRLPELRGKNLACWCHLCDRHKNGKPLGVECKDCDPCHADPLLELANESADRGGPTGSAAGASVPNPASLKSTPQAQGGESNG